MGTDQGIFVYTTIHGSVPGCPLGALPAPSSPLYAEMWVMVSRGWRRGAGGEIGWCPRFALNRIGTTAGANWDMTNRFHSLRN